MTLMPLSAAFCSTFDSVVPSIEATTRTLSALVTMFSICASWLGMSSSAYCRSVLYPRACSTLTMLSPSAIQRAEDLVGIAMPTVPLSCAAAVPAITTPKAAKANIVLKNFTFSSPVAVARPAVWKLPLARSPAGCRSCHARQPDRIVNPPDGRGGTNGWDNFLIDFRHLAIYDLGSHDPGHPHVHQRHPLVHTRPPEDAPAAPPRGDGGGRQHPRGRAGPEHDPARGLQAAQGPRGHARGQAVRPPPAWRA